MENNYYVLSYNSECHDIVILAGPVIRPKAQDVLISYAKERLMELNGISAECAKHVMEHPDGQILDSNEDSYTLYFGDEELELLSVTQYNG